MQRQKFTVTVLLALGIFLSLALASWAQPWGMKGHRGPWGHCGLHGKFADLTPEQAGKLFDLRQKFMDDTAGLRKDMLVKRMELKALWRAENPDEKQILAKHKEINAVMEKLQEKFVPFRLQVKKILPPNSGPKGKLSLEDEENNLDSTLSLEFDGTGGGDS